MPRPITRRRKPAAAVATRIVETLEARRLLAGDLDLTFGEDGRVTTDIIGSASQYGWGVAVQEDGKVVVAGQHQIFAERFGDIFIARFNTDGTIDTTFGGGDGITPIDFGGTQDFAYAVGVDSQGRIVAAGYTSSDVTQADSDFAVARVTADGTIDTTFGSNGDGRVVFDFDGGRDTAWGLAVRPDDGVVVVGSTLHTPGPGSSFAIAALDADGTPDADFNGSGQLTADVGLSSGAVAVAIDGQGRFVVTGSSSLSTNNSDFATARPVLPDGSMDGSFGPNGDGTVVTSFGTWYDYARDVAISPSGKIVVAGEASLPLGTGFHGDFGVVRYTEDGLIDSTFGGGDGKVNVDFGTLSARTDDIAMGVEVLENESILIGGNTERSGANQDTASFARLTPEGNLDNLFDFDGKLSNRPGFVYGMTMAPDNNIVTVQLGSIDVGSYPDVVLTRRLPRGAFDPTFGPGGADGDGVVTVDFKGPSSNVLRSVLALPDGRVLAAGTTWTGFVGGLDSVLARYHADGTLDTTFGGAGTGIVVVDAGGRDELTDLAVQSDGKIVLAGRTNDTTLIAMRFTPDGAPDAAFGTAGRFTADRFETFPVVIDGEVALAIQGDDKLVLTAFVDAGFNNRAALLRLTPSGAPDPTFGGGDGVFINAASGANNVAPAAVAVGPGGKIIVAGVASNDRTATVFRHLPDGTLDTSFSTDGIATADFGSSSGYTVTSVLPDPTNDSVLIGGSMTPNSIDRGPVRDFGLIRFLADGSLDATFGTGGKVRTDLLEGNDFLNELVRLPDGSIVAVGTARTPGGGSDTRRNGDFALAKYLPSGELDTDFGPAGDGKVTTDFAEAGDGANGATFDAAGRLIAVGTAFVPGQSNNLALARYQVLEEPAVAQVAIGSSAWGTPFLSGLGATGARATNVAGAGASGSGAFVLYPGPDAQVPLPWVNLDSVAVRFTGPAFEVTRDSLRLAGVNVPDYAVRDFRYDPLTRIAVWTLAAPISNDRIDFQIDKDGDSDFEFHRAFAVLGGDADRGGAVNALDLADAKRRLNRSAAEPGAGNGAYGVFADVTADGRINALDLSAIKQRLNRRLPAAPVPPAPLAVLPSASVTREVFGAIPILAG